MACVHGFRPCSSHQSAFERLCSAARPGAVGFLQFVRIGPLSLGRQFIQARDAAAKQLTCLTWLHDERTEFVVGKPGLQMDIDVLHSLRHAHPPSAPSPPGCDGDRSRLILRWRQSSAPVSRPAPGWDRSASRPPAPRASSGLQGTWVRAPGP
jgi:hypothetical protein